jgi:serine/threonine protein kinase
LPNFTNKGWHFIVMELIEGETLRKKLNCRGPLPEIEVIDIALKVCHALAAGTGSTKRPPAIEIAG